MLSFSICYLRIFKKMFLLPISMWEKSLALPVYHLSRTNLKLQLYLPRQQAVQ